MRLLVVTALALCGCVGPPDELHDPEMGAPAVDDDEPPTPTPVRNFSWAVNERLAGMARPGVTHPLAGDLAFLVEQDIDLLVSLTEEPLDATTIAESGLEWMHLPVRDFTAPTLDQLRQFVREVDRRHKLGQAIGVHCGAGQGRTGTFLAAYFVDRGMTAAAAIAEVRRLRPGSIETKAQEARIAEFEGTLLRERNERQAPPTR